MIDVRLLRTDPEGTRAALARRGSPELLDQLAEATSTDSRLRDIQTQRDTLRAEVNNLSKQVGQARRDGDTARAEDLQARSRAAGEQEKALAAEADTLAAHLRDLLLRIPNLPHPDAPDGAGDHDNPVVKGPFLPEAGFPEHQRVPHWDTATALGILDNERATKISGAMFTMQRGPGAQLSRALCQPRWTATAMRSRRSARRRWSPPRRSPPPASCPSSPTTPTPSSGTTCGASPLPRCR
ncbi:MAG: hypothetical protein R2694_12130 [Ilumatobacteraceae bacterium]